MIKVYTTPSCVYCQSLKAYFKERNIEFTEIDVSKDQAAAEEMIKRSGQMGVPVLDINGEIVVGFDKEQINKLLKING